jgi:hypothetical protein
MVAEALRTQYACEPAIVDMASFPLEQKAAFQCGGSTNEVATTIGELDLRQVGAVWWRRPTAANVPDNYFVFDRDFLQIECDQFLQGLIWSTDCNWINNPGAEARASRKLCQLAAASRIGLIVPRTIITNNIVLAREFVASLDRLLVTKRIGTARGTATKTTLLTSHDYDRLHTIETCPTIFQEYVEPGADIRVVLIGEEHHSFMIDSAAGIDPVDSRIDLSVEHRPYELPQGLHRLLRQVLDHLGLIFGVIDLRLSAKGEYYFLEVNPSGQYAYLELMTGVPLSNRMAGLLAKFTSSYVGGGS